jgi:hypothetical protein
MDLDDFVEKTRGVSRDRRNAGKSGDGADGES